MTTPADVAAASAPRTRFETVALDNPIVRGETRIDSLTLRKPSGGDLRGINLQDIIVSDVAAMLKLLPRISDPPITPDEAEALEAEDVAMVAGTIRGFFYSRAERKAVDEFIAAQLSKN